MPSIGKFRAFGDGGAVGLTSDSGGVHLSIVGQVLREAPNLGALLELRGVISLLIGDHDDVSQQSQRLLGNYLDWGWDTTGLVVIPGDPHDMVDTSSHPGRVSEYGQLTLWATSRMWFGETMLELFGGRPHVLEFPDANGLHQIDELVAVELFELDDPIELIRERQRAFRDWVGMDELAEQGRFMTPGDPIEHYGRGEHEGRPARFVTSWFDVDGRRVVRSQGVTARQMVIFESGESISLTGLDPTLALPEG